MTQLTGFRTDRIGSYIEKDPQARLDYSMDWSDWLASGDPIQVAQWSVSTVTSDTANVVIHSNTTSGVTGISTAIISGGSAGNIYTVTCKITTTNGLIDERYFRLSVQDRSA